MLSWNIHELRAGILRAKKIHSEEAETEPEKNTNLLFFGFQQIS